jgi:xylitol oxidase
MSRRAVSGSVAGVQGVTNWAGNLTYSTERVLRPVSVDEAQELIRAERSIRPLGTRHSFSLVGDSDVALLSTEHLNRIVAVGADTVTVEAGIRYGELAAALHEHGAALANFASLPHISVGGAIATATHGSGSSNRSLAGAISALELIGADGSIQRLRRGDPDFDGTVVSLGALGLVARVSLDVVRAFDLRQYVFERLPWSKLEAELDAILGGGYSVSLFTMWDEPSVGTVWVKTTDELVGQSYFGAAPAPEPRNPVPGAHWENATEQLGVSGPSYSRLPHFRLGFTPSSGNELQTEYVVPREHGPAAVSELRRLSSLFSPLLYVAEIRSIAADSLWLSPFFEQDSIAFHFTWQPRPAEVLAVLPQMESALSPFGLRPHWGKLFVGSAAGIEAVYPKLPDFRRLANDLDASGKFGNAFLRAYVFGEG